MAYRERRPNPHRRKPHRSHSFGGDVGGPMPTSLILKRTTQVGLATLTVLGVGYLITNAGGWFNDAPSAIPGASSSIPTESTAQLQQENWTLQPQSITVQIDPGNNSNTDIMQLAQNQSGETALAVSTDGGQDWQLIEGAAGTDVVDATFSPYYIIENGQYIPLALVIQTQDASGKGSLTLLKYDPAANGYEITSVTNIINPPHNPNDLGSTDYKLAGYPEGITNSPVDSAYTWAFDPNSGQVTFTPRYIVQQGDTFSLVNGKIPLDATVQTKGKQIYIGDSVVASCTNNTTIYTNDWTSVYPQ